MPGKEAHMLETNLINTARTLEDAIERARQHLMNAQNLEGYWVGELEADASVSAGYIPLMFYITGKVDPVKQAKVIKYVRSKQRDDGSWSTYYGGPGDLSVTVQVYFALKLAGISAQEPYMQKAKDFVLSRGGVMKTNTITRIWLAVFGQFDYRGTPSIPPALVLFPNWFYFNIYEFASWSRETIMALMIVLNSQPVCAVPESARISELYVEPEGERRFRPAEGGRFLSWRRAFLMADNLIKIAEKSPWKPFRSMSMRKIERWVVQHQEVDGSWGGIMLPWVYSLIALKSLGYALDHPVVAKALKGLDVFIVEDDETLRLQPAVSPIWDTAWASLALCESGLSADHPTLTKACNWLLDQEIRVAGDWKIKNPGTQPAGWAFEFDNDLYPDIDDTAVVARALLNLKLDQQDETRKLAAAKRGLQWVKEMQDSDGGWAAFDRDNNKQILAYIPYADFITPLDPTSPDVTAHAIELISHLDPHCAELKRALEYLKRVQELDGSWYGRWGVNYIYGTGLVLVSLQSAGEDMHQQYVGKAVKWLIDRQNDDGGWGESCETYDDPGAARENPSTASQTAWALMGLIAAGQQSGPNVARGVSYLLGIQNRDGSWTEDAYTGTGFPKAFYLRYDLYRIYFPLLVLSQYRSYQEVNRG
jgi:squalene-hopene/tetraprenyl-beta-curcumene cyclase